MSIISVFFLSNICVHKGNVLGVSQEDVSFTHTKHVFLYIDFKIVHKYVLFSEFIVAEIISN